MARWEPGTRDRLRTAALELYLEQGYEATTVEQIAARAGVTERTYFRHFPDKREVLFDADDHLGKSFVAGITDAAPGPPMALVVAGLEASASVFPDSRRPWSRARQTVIEANPALREREMLKLNSLGTAIAAALRARGIAEPTASVTAQTGLSVFHVAFETWISDAEHRGIGEIQRALIEELKTVVAEA